MPLAIGQNGISFPIRVEGEVSGSIPCVCEFCMTFLKKRKVGLSRHPRKRPTYPTRANLLNFGQFRWAVAVGGRLEALEPDSYRLSVRFPTWDSNTPDLGDPEI